MSLASWKKEFYSIEAKECSKEKALDHSIRKWTGLLKSNLKKHKVEKIYERVIDGSGDTLYINVSSCALCCYFVVLACSDCPLCEVRGQTRCDTATPIEGQDPYHAFTRYGDARPMLKWLKRAKKAATK
jgi:hypothetical protein